MLGLALALGSWLLTLLARRWNRRAAGAAFFAATGVAVLLALAACGALLAGPWLAGMDPTRHAYDATVWLLLAWTVAHVAAGALMLAYCIARRAAGRMTAMHDSDLHNVALDWHFVAVTVVVTVAVVAFFPLLAH